MNGWFVQSFREVDDGNSTKRTAIRADATASTEKFVNAGFLSWVIPWINTISSGTINGAEFSAKVVATFVWMALVPVNNSDTFSHGFPNIRFIFIPFG